MSESLQDRFAPQSVCFGCGPANPQGLRIKSRVEGDRVVCDWTPQPFHHAFDDILNGGITAALLDCHGNWTAVHAFMVRERLEAPPPTVTADMTVKMLRPTPMTSTLHLTAGIYQLMADRATVDASLEADGKLRATMRATFVKVKEGHPAFSRWTGPSITGTSGKKV
jgi:acyl-coenzyme A thioesterase PaaI-like protein